MNVATIDQIATATIVRLFEPRDAIAMMAMLHELHAESSFSFLPLEEDKLRTMLGLALAFPESRLCLVSEFDGELTGCFYGVLVEYYFNYERMAHDEWLFVRKPYRGTHAASTFIKRFDAWADECGARESMISPSTGIQTARTVRWLNTLDYGVSGVMTKRRIS